MTASGRPAVPGRGRCRPQPGARPLLAAGRRRPRRASPGTPDAVSPPGHRGWPPWAQPATGRQQRGPASPARPSAQSRGRHLERWSTPAVVVDVVSGCADPGSLWTLRGLLDLKIDPLALLERLVARTADRGVVDEDVARAVIRGDEAVALLRVEPLHSSLRHACSPRALSAVTRGVEHPDRVLLRPGGCALPPCDAARTPGEEQQRGEQYRLSRSNCYQGDRWIWDVFHRTSLSPFIQFPISCRTAPEQLQITGSGYESPPGFPDRPARTSCSWYLAAASAAAPLRYSPRRSSADNAATTIEAPSMRKCRRAACLVSENPKPSAPSAT